MPFPRRCFVSHSYSDEHQLEVLRKAIPPQSELVIFPMMDADPSNPVSDGILPKIMGCDGLIYLEGGESSQSKWVAFEIDYARRLGKPVYSFLASASELLEDTSEPVDLRVQVVVGSKNLSRANRLLKWMDSERSFTLENVGTTNKMDEVPLVFIGIRENREVALWLLDPKTAALLNIHDKEIDERLLLDFNDGVPLPPPAPNIRARIDPEWQPYTSEDRDVQEVIYDTFQTSNYIDLVHRSSKDEFNWNRVDELIVRLTWACIETSNWIDFDDE